MHWYRFRKKHGYICSIHELRHTFISLTKNSLPLDLLQRTVGHTKDMDTYGVYGHEVLGEMEEEKALIQGVFLNLRIRNVSQNDSQRKRKSLETTAAGHRKTLRNKIRRVFLCFY